MKQTRELLICALSLLTSLAAPADVKAQALATIQPDPTAQPRDRASTFTAVDYPGAASTQIWNISPRGDIVGVYTTADSVSHGFLLSHGSFRSIDFPGAALTLVNGINAAGDIVGEYAPTATAPHRGFLLSKDRFWPIDYPGAASTAGIGIAHGGDILGSYTSQDNSPHGFLLRGSTFTKIDYPGAASTVVGGISPGGDIVGGYDGHAFSLSHGQFTSWDYPGSAFTNALARNVSGDVVGRYRDAAGAVHGYVVSHGQFMSFDFPGASFTGATGITADGDIVGRYMLAGVSHGFLLTSREQNKPAYTVIDLGQVGGPPGQALFISSNDLVSGAAAATDGAMHAVLWYLRTKLDIGAHGLGGLNSVAFNVNERRQTVGYAETSSSDPYGEDFCGFKTLGLPYQGAACLPFLWQNGLMTALPTLGGQNGVASWINNRGEVAGWVENTTSDPGCPAPQRFQFKPVIWANGNVQELPTFGDPNGVAISINDKGQVVGGSGECSPYNQSVLANLQPVHALLWQDGVPTNLGSLGGTGHGLGNVATAINNKGQVVGSSDLPGDTANHAFSWTRETGMQDLGTLAGDIGSGAIGINDGGEVVGVSTGANFNFRAFLWRNGAMTDLNSLVAGDSPLFMIFAIAINSRGEIVGLAVDKNSGDAHAFLATPEQGRRP